MYVLLSFDGKTIVAGPFKTLAQAERALIRRRVPCGCGSPKCRVKVDLARVGTI